VAQHRESLTITSLLFACFRRYCHAVHRQTRFSAPCLAIRSVSLGVLLALLACIIPPVLRAHERATLEEEAEGAESSHLQLNAAARKH
jgi:hypothetical protein